MIDADAVLGFEGFERPAEETRPLRLLYNLGGYDASDPELASKPMLTSGQASILSAFSSSPLPEFSPPLEGSGAPRPTSA